jgi:phage terminase large subunit-like protein
MAALSHSSTSHPQKRTSSLNAKQEIVQELLAGPQRHTMLVGGSRSGKTTLLVRAIGIRALRSEGSRHAILRQHGNAARGSIALDTLPKVFRTWFSRVALREHRQDGYFSLPNGSEIWVGGLDDKLRVEKILGKEFATIYLNECSQIPYASVPVVLTRLAQVVPYLRQRAYYDLNPVGKGHWTNQLFGEKRDPLTRQPLTNPDDYARAFINPADNAENLSPEYLASLANMSERQRKRFYEGVYVDELEGALWTYEGIDHGRVDDFPIERCRRIVVAVDPSGASSAEHESADEIGIVVAGLGDDGHAYILADRSVRDGPAVWGRIAVTAFHEFKADRIVAEVNYGGEMVRFVIRAADPNVPVEIITAARGKAVRAEPVSYLYGEPPDFKKCRVHHVGRFPALEDQLCAFTQSGYHGEDSPDHADALVWALTDLMLSQPAGWGILEFTRQQAQANQPQAKPAVPSTRLKATTGTGVVYGVSGKQYMVGADGIVVVDEADAEALTKLGFEPVAPATS